MKLRDTLPTRRMGVLAGLLLFASTGCSSYLVCAEPKIMHRGILVPVYKEYLSIQTGAAEPFQVVRIPDPGRKCWVTERRPCKCANFRNREQQQVVDCMPVAATLLPSLLEKGIVYTAGEGPKAGLNRNDIPLNGEPLIGDGLYDVTPKLDLRLVARLTPPVADPPEAPTPPSIPATPFCTGTIVNCPASPSAVLPHSPADSYNFNLDNRTFQAGDLLSQTTVLLQEITRQLQDRSSSLSGSGPAAPSVPAGHLSTTIPPSSSKETPVTNVEIRLDRVQVEYGENDGCPVGLELFFSGPLAQPPRIKLYPAGSSAAAPASSFGFASATKNEPERSTEEKPEPTGEAAYRIGVAGIPTQNNGLREFWVGFAGRASRIWVRSKCPLIP